MNDPEKNNKKQTGKGSRKKAAVILTIVLVLLGAIAGLLALVSRLKRSKAKANDDYDRKDGKNYSGDSSTSNKNEAIGPRIVDKKETARKLPKIDPPAGQETSGDNIQQNKKAEGYYIKETTTNQPNAAVPVHQTTEQPNAALPERQESQQIQKAVGEPGKTDNFSQLHSFKRAVSDTEQPNNTLSGSVGSGGELNPIQRSTALPLRQNTAGNKIQQNQVAGKKNAKDAYVSKQLVNMDTELQKNQKTIEENGKKENALNPPKNAPPAGQNSSGEKIQHNQRAEQLDKVSPGDVHDNLEKDLKAEGIWNLSELEASFNALQTHSKKDEIVALHPELAANSVYEAYFDKFKDKIDTLMKSYGPLNILNATDMMDHLAQNCKSKLDEWIDSECTQTAGTTPNSDQCYYLRKASIVQGLKDALNNGDFIKFKNQYVELINLLRPCTTDDESVNAVQAVFRDVETNASIFVNGLFDIKSTVDFQIDGDENDTLSTRIGKLDQLKKICELVKIKTYAIIAKKKELILNVVDRNNMNDPNLVTIIKDKTSGLDHNDLDVPYFITQTTSDKALKFWRAQKCKMILDDDKLKDKHTPSNAIFGSETFKTSYEVVNFVSSTLVQEVELLKAEAFECVNVNPPNETKFMETVKTLIHLNRSLIEQKFAEHEVLKLRSNENTNLQDVLSSLIYGHLSQGSYEEFEALANFSKEIDHQFKLPNTCIEISTKDEYDEARRILIVKSNFESVADGALNSKLPLINAELVRIGLEAIDEASVRRILVKAGMFRELARSDDHNHTQYKAIKSEISNELKDFLGKLDGDISCFYEKLNALKALMNAWIDEFDETDEIEPKSSSYFCTFLIEKVNDLNGSIRTTIVPGYYEKMCLARNINTELKCEIQDIRDSIIKDEALNTFYTLENKTSYDQTTDLSKDPFFQKFKALYNRMWEPTADKTVAFSLYLAAPPNSPAKTQSLNLLVYHNIVPSLAESEYKAGCSVPAVAKKAKDAIYNVIQSIRMEPHGAMVLDELKTQIIAGKKGNGLVMFWHDLITSGNGKVKFYDDLHEAKASVIDPLIANALTNLKDTYSNTTITSEVKRVYARNYEVLKCLHSNPRSFPPLSKN